VMRATEATGRTTRASAAVEVGLRAGEVVVGGAHVQCAKAAEVGREGRKRRLEVRARHVGEVVERQRGDSVRRGVLALKRSHASCSAAVAVRPYAVLPSPKSCVETNRPMGVAETPPSRRSCSSGAIEDDCVRALYSSHSH
jgi:hypothetical protein